MASKPKDIAVILKSLIAGELVIISAGVGTWYIQKSGAMYHIEGRDFVPHVQPRFMVYSYAKAFIVGELQKAGLYVKSEVKKFDLGHTVVTQLVDTSISSSDLELAMDRFTSCDWGLTSKADKKLNNDAVKFNNDRIVAKYESSNGHKFFIITERDRSSTTILLTSEY